MFYECANLRNTKITTENSREAIAFYTRAMCSYIACTIVQKETIKKAFLKEYRQNQYLYEKNAKMILSPEFDIKYIMELPITRRTDAVCVCAVTYTMLVEQVDVERFFSFFKGKQNEYQQVVDGLCKYSGETVNVRAYEKLMKRYEKLDPCLFALYAAGELLTKNYTNENQIKMRLDMLELAVSSVFEELPTEKDEKLMRNFLENSFLRFETKKLSEISQYAMDSIDTRELSISNCADLEATWVAVSNLPDVIDIACHFAGYSLSSICSNFVVSKQRLMEAAFCAIQAMNIYNYPNDVIFHVQKDYEDIRKRNDFSLGARQVLQAEFDQCLLAALYSAALASNSVLETKQQISNELFPKVIKPTTIVPDSGTLVRLQTQIDNLEKQVARLENEKNAVEAKLFSARNRESALKSKIEELKANSTGTYAKAKIAKSALSADIPLSEQHEQMCPETTSTSSENLKEIDYSSRLDKLFSENKICIVGGNENLIKKFRSKHSDGIYIGKEKEATCDQTIRGSDVVLFKYDACAHSLYDKCKSIAQRANVPFGYIEDVASLTLLEKKICKTVEQLLS